MLYTLQFSWQYPPFGGGYFSIFRKVYSNLVITTFAIHSSSFIIHRY